MSAAEGILHSVPRIIFFWKEPCWCKESIICSLRRHGHPRKNNINDASVYGVPKMCLTAGGMVGYTTYHYELITSMSLFLKELQMEGKKTEGTSRREFLKSIAHMAYVVPIIASVALRAKEAGASQVIRRALRGGPEAGNSPSSPSLPSSPSSPPPGGGKGIY